jgi:putative membrane protein insertion efficiency factor
MSLPAKIFLGLIWLYQRSFSTIMGKSCRFYPTCSAYTAESIRRFGAGKGTVLGISRLCRCHPWGGGGHDPVPQEFPEKFFSKKTRCCDRSLGQ